MINNRGRRMPRRRALRRGWPWQLPASRV